MKVKIVLLGASGYVGTAFRELLSQKGIEWHPVSRKTVDIFNVSQLRDCLRTLAPSFVINAAGYTGKPNVDACELHRRECLAGNALLPGVLDTVTKDLGIAWGHVSSGCIYTGTRSDGNGFTEEDSPNFSFRTNNCSFYSGCKALGEECLVGSENCFIWRLRIPFNHVDSGRNYLSKVMRYPKLLEATNSISHLNEFVAACVACWERRVPFGIYNVVNSGAITTRQVTESIVRELGWKRPFEFFESEEQFMNLAAKTPRSNCVLDNRKLLSTGIEMSDVHDAVSRSLKAWKPE